MNLSEKIDKMNNLVDLHIHLDGALSLDNCKSIAKLQNISLPSDEEILNMISLSENCRNLEEFLTKFDFPLSLLQTSIGIKNAIKNLLNELEKQGLIYVEIRFAPQLHTKKGLTQEEVVLSAISAIKSEKIKCNLILCCMRNNNNYEENIQTVSLAKKYLDKGVCAIDLAGAEKLYKTKNFKYVFDYAKELGIPFTIHAGEADGSESVYTAIEYGAKRIGHGVRSIEDSNLVKEIASKNITLEVCPSSNICTSVYKKISDIVKFYIE